VAGLLQRIENLLEALADARVEDRFELLAARWIAEHDGGHAASVELAALVDDIAAERAHHLAETFAAGGDDDARELVGGDHGYAVFLEEFCDAGLAAADATRESVHVHDAACTGPQARVGREYGARGAPV
jgi:hypothetical protein